MNEKGLIYHTIAENEDRTEIILTISSDNSISIEEFYGTLAILLERFIDSSKELKNMPESAFKQ
jgi:hypothetical protein